MKKVEFRFLQLAPSHVSGERLTLALLHWDGERLRVAWSLDPLAFCEANKRDILKRTVLAKLVRAAKQASRATETKGAALKDVVPVREGLGASLYWSPIQASLTGNPQAHFEEIKRTLRIQDDVTPIAEEYERLLIASHDAILGSDSDAARSEELAARLQDLQPLLSDRERRLFAALASDLAPQESSQPASASGNARRLLAEGMQDAWLRRDWETVLDYLRRAPDLIPAEQRAYSQARCWDGLGFRHAYIAFLDRAAESAPGNARYPALAILGLSMAGRIEEALDRAERVLEKDIGPPILQIQATHAFFRSTRSLDESRARPVLERIASILQRVLKNRLNLHAEPGLRSSVAGAFVELGLCYERLGDPTRAHDVYGEAIRIDSENDAALVARGLLTFAEEPEAAASDFQKAASASTKLPWPYVFLAHWHLTRGCYAKCVAMCEQAEPLLVDQPSKLANLLEWKAIAQIHLGAPRDEVHSLFESALAQEPLNDRIRQNLEVFKAWAAGGEDQRTPPDLRIERDTSPEEARGKALKPAA